MGTGSMSVLHTSLLALDMYRADAEQQHVPLHAWKLTVGYVPRIRKRWMGVGRISCQSHQITCVQLFQQQHPRYYHTVSGYICIYFRVHTYHICAM